VYVAYTQVEVIRLFLGRWHALQPATVEAPATAELPGGAEEAPAALAQENPPAEVAGEGDAP
jgi:hypothetical protein